MEYGAMLIIEEYLQTNDIFIREVWLLNIVEGGGDVIDIPELIFWLHHHLLVRSLHQMVPSEQMKVYMKYLIVFYWMFNLQSVV